MSFEPAGYGCAYPLRTGDSHRLHHDTRWPWRHHAVFNSFKGALRAEATGGPAATFRRRRLSVRMWRWSVVLASNAPAGGPAGSVAKQKAPSDAGGAWRDRVGEFL